MIKNKNLLTLRTKKVLLSTLILSSCALLTGCSEDEHSDLKSWIKSQEQTVRGRVEPLPRNLDYVAIPFEGAPGIDPFKIKQVKISLGEDQKSKKQQTTPEMDRRKEPLEFYNLSEVAITGFIKKDGRTYALLKSQKDNIVHTITVGNYIGVNFGKITKIENDKVYLRELLLVGDEWSEKETILDLAEDSKSAGPAAKR